MPAYFLQAATGSSDEAAIGQEGIYMTHGMYLSGSVKVLQTKKAERIHEKPISMLYIPFLPSAA